MLGTGVRDFAGTAFMAGASVWLHDFNKPTATLTHTGTINAWTSTTARSVKVGATDAGLGIDRFLLTGGQTTTPNRDQACGHVGKRCLSSDSDTFAYTVPEGEHQVAAYAYDPVDNKGGSSWYVKVDLTPPTIKSLTGTLTTARPVRRGKYTLTVNADDTGDNAATNSGVKRIEYKLDDQAWSSDRAASKTCASGACQHTFTIDTTGLRDGPHTVYAQAIDALDKSSTVKAFPFALEVAKTPTNTQLPTITEPADTSTPGGADVIAGAVLKGTNGSWSPSTNLSYAHQWLRCDDQGSNFANILGATKTEYRLTPADAGHRLRFRVTATNKPADQTASPASKPADSQPSRLVGPDTFPPSLTRVEHPGRPDLDWRDEYQTSVTPTARDVGLGIYGFTLTEPLKRADGTDGTSPDDDKTREMQRSEALLLPTEKCDARQLGRLCKTEDSEIIEYNTAGYRQGIVPVYLRGHDDAQPNGEGNKSVNAGGVTNAFEVKVDHEAPQISLSEAVRAVNGKAITQPGTYPLQPAVTDGVRGGTDPEQRSGVASVEVLVSKDEGPFESLGARTNDACTGESCPGADYPYDIDTTVLGEGLHASESPPPIACMASLCRTVRIVSSVSAITTRATYRRSWCASTWICGTLRSQP